jgi:hypothetical protein
MSRFEAKKKNHPEKAQQRNVRTFHPVPLGPTSVRARAIGARRMAKNPKRRRLSMTICEPPANDKGRFHYTIDDRARLHAGLAASVAIPYEIMILRLSSEAACGVGGIGRHTLRDHGEPAGKLASFRTFNPGEPIARGGGWVFSQRTHTRRRMGL